MSSKKIIIYLFLSYTQVYGDDPLNSIVNTFVGLGNMFSAMGDAFAAQGGVVPLSQRYSFQVFNNSSMPITAQIAKVKMIMGGPTSDGLGSVIVLNPGQDSDTLFYNAHLYFNIEFPEAHFEETHCDMGMPNDRSVYVYNIYEDSTGPHGELVYSSSPPTVAAAITTTIPVPPPLSKDFSGMIYNGSPSTVPFTFTFTVPSSILTTTNTITIPLESDVFHSLQSTNGTTLRPGIMQIPNSTCILAPQGFATSIPSLIVTQTLTTPMCYNYEILPTNKLVQSGFSVGTYKQPKNGKIRTITPLLYTIWNPSSADLKVTDTSSLVPFASSKSHSVWALYTGSVYSTVQQKIINQPLIKIPDGKAISFYLIRPQFSKKKDILYIFNALSTNDVATQSLLSQFFTTPVPRFTATGLSYASPTGNYSYTLPAGMNSKDVFTLFNTLLPSKIGLFSKNGASAYIVFQKTLSSYSSNTAPCFCMVQPPYYSSSGILSGFLQYFDPAKMTAAVQTKLLQQIPQWVDLYATNYALLKTQVTQYLIQYGVSTLVTTSGKNPLLTPLGEVALFMILHGPCSLSKVPLLYSVSADFTSVPTQWVDPKNVIQF